MASWHGMAYYLRFCVPQGAPGLRVTGTELTVEHTTHLAKSMLAGMLAITPTTLRRGMTHLTALAYGGQTKGTVRRIRRDVAPVHVTGAGSSTQAGPRAAGAAAARCAQPPPPQHGAW